MFAKTNMQAASSWRFCRVKFSWRPGITWRTTVLFPTVLPSGKHTKNELEHHHFSKLFMGKSTKSMAMFHFATSFSMVFPRLGHHPMMAPTQFFPAQFRIPEIRPNDPRYVWPRRTGVTHGKFMGFSWVSMGCHGFETWKIPWGFFRGEQDEHGHLFWDLDRFSGF